MESKKSRCIQISTSITYNYEIFVTIRNIRNIFFQTSSFVIVYRLYQANELEP